MRPFAPVLIFNWRFRLPGRIARVVSCNARFIDKDRLALRLSMHMGACCNSKAGSMNHHSYDQLVLLSSIPKLIEKRTGQRPHISTIHRWVQRGINGVKLRTTFVGGYRRTSQRWLQEFFDAVKISRDGTAGDDSQDRWRSLDPSKNVDRFPRTAVLNDLIKEGL